MARLFGCALSLLATAVLIAPASAMEPLQRSHSTTPTAAVGTTSLDLSAEQAHFSGSSARIGDTQSANEPPTAPGEEGLAPKGHALLVLDL